MKITNSELVKELRQLVNQHLQKAKTYQQLDIHDLNWKESPEKWSVLECIEHLNRYGDFYVPEITKRIQHHAIPSKNLVFKSGWLGSYFAKSMLPKEKLNKMKTFPSMNPTGSKLDKTVLHVFIEQQQQLLTLLKKAESLDLSKMKTAISISKWIKLRLGDTFRVVIYHNERHIVQAETVLSLKHKQHQSVS